MSVSAFAVAAALALQSVGPQFDLVCATERWNDDYEPTGETRMVRLSVDLTRRRWCMDDLCDGGTMAIQEITDEEITFIDFENMNIVVNRMNGDYYYSSTPPNRERRLFVGSCVADTYTRRERLF